MTTTTESLARRMASHGTRLYYTVKPWRDEFRLRVYTVVSGQVTGLDQLLDTHELQALSLTRTPYAHSRTNGPGGLVLAEGHPRYHTCYAAVRAVGRILGLDVEPTAL